MSSLETNQEYSKILEDNVKLTCKAVAVKLLASEEELPEGYDLIDEKVRHCEMIRKASYGEKFYSTIEQQSCLGGAGAIGLRDMPPKLASGEKYFELGRFKDLKTAKAATEKLSIIKERYWGIVYSPLDEATFKPDVVLIITEPVGGMKLAQTIVYSSGDKVRPNFAGIQSLCGDALANPFITGGVNFTLGCDGSRNAADIKDNEMTIGISGEKYFELGRFKDLKTAKAATEKLSIIKERYWGIVYSPLDEATFKPDVVLIITEPVGGMKLAQTIVYSSGDKVRPNFAGIQSLCGDALANPFITGGVNFTLGCDGSRNAADIKDNEMTIGISGEKLEEVISNLQAI